VCWLTRCRDDLDHARLNYCPAERRDPFPFPYNYRALVQGHIIVETRGEGRTRSAGDGHDVFPPPPGEVTGTHDRAGT
jgi:hypothetical protein